MSLRRLFVVLAVLTWCSTAMADELSVPDLPTPVTQQLPPASAPAVDSALSVDSAIAFGTVRPRVNLATPPSKTKSFSGISLQFGDADPWSEVADNWALDIGEIRRRVSDKSEGDATFVFWTGSGSSKLVDGADGLLEDQVGTGAERTYKKLDAQGEMYFERVDVNGTTFVFGANENSRVGEQGQIARWRLSSVTDTNGNRVAFSYEVSQEGRVSVVKQIEYDQHDAIGGGPIRLVFGYVDRPSVSKGWFRGAGWTAALQLATVRVETRADPTSAWRLEYTYILKTEDRTDPSGPLGLANSPALTAVLLRTSDSVEKSLHRFEYVGTQWAKADHGFSSRAINADLKTASVRVLDGDGPARTGLWTATGNSFSRLFTPAEHITLLATAPASDIATRLSASRNVAGTSLCTTADDDLYCANTEAIGALADSSPQPIYLDWKGTALSKVAFINSVRLGDIDGDGKVDVCGNGAGGLLCYTAIFSSNGTKDRRQQPSFTWAQAASWSEEDLSTWSLVDINADKKADICWFSGSKVSCAVMADTVPSSALVESAFALNRKDDAATLSWVNLNDDDYSDFCAKAGTILACRLGTGTGFVETEGVNFASYPTTDITFVYSLVYLSLNGDGLTDLCFMSKENEFVCKIRTSNGFSGFLEGPKWPVSFAIAGGAATETNLYSKRPPQTLGSEDNLRVNPEYLDWLELVGSPVAMDEDGDGIDELCVRLSKASLSCWSPQATGRFRVTAVVSEDGAREEYEWTRSGGETSRTAWQGNHERMGLYTLTARTTKLPTGDVLDRTEYAYAHGYYDQATRSFRGFGNVGETRFVGSPLRKHSVYSFYQGDDQSEAAPIPSLSGVLRKVQTDEGGYRVLSLHYSDAQPQASAVRRPRLRMVVRQQCSGEGCTPVEPPSDSFVDRTRPGKNFPMPKFPDPAEEQLRRSPGLKSLLVGTMPVSKATRVDAHLKLTRAARLKLTHPL